MVNRYIYGFIAVILTSACGFLDIDTPGIVNNGKMFENGQGFIDAMDGVYASMADDGLYGKELSFGFIDEIAQLYFNDYGEGETTLTKSIDLKYRDSDVRARIDAIWSGAYNVISSANSIIDNVSGHSYPELPRIEGEALAVRALLHFDMLRLFAPAPAVADDKPYIPYLETFPYYGGQANESVENILTKVARDLTEAKELINTFDTLDKTRRAKLSSFSRFQLATGGTNAGAFYEYRGYRINIMAVTGLLARVYSYWGKYDKAFELANEAADFVYDETDKNKALTYTSGRQVNNDRKFSSDLMFCLSDINMTENYQTYSAVSSNDYLNLDGSVVQFEGTPEADAGDYRLTYLMERNARGKYVGYAPLKYIKLDNGDEAAKKVADMLPVIRLSEMHFIMAEAKANEGNFSETDGANYYLNLVREGRNCKKMNLGITDMESFKKQLFMEVRKEDCNEGHTFYYFKKYNTLLTKKMLPENFIIPIPQSEKIN